MDLKPLDIPNDEVKPSLEGFEKPPIPLEEVNYKATIATLAAERVKDFTNNNIITGDDASQTKQLDFTRYAEMLQQGQEDEIRSELASEVVANKLNLMNELQIDATEGDDPELLKALLDLDIGIDIENEKLTVLEREAAKQIVEKGEEEEGRLQNAWTPWTEIESDRMARKLFMEDNISKLVNKIDFDVDTLTDLNLFWPGVTPSFLNQNVKTSLDPFWPGNDLEAQYSKFQVLSLDEQRVVVDDILLRHEDDPIHALIVLGYLSDLTNWDVWLENAGGVADLFVLGLLSISKFSSIAKGVKIANSLRKGDVAAAGISAGNRESALKQATAMKDAVDNGDIPYGSEAAAQAAELMLETQHIPFNDFHGVTVSGAYRESMKEINKATDSFMHTSRVRLLDPVQRDKMIRSMEAQLADDLKDYGSVHANISSAIAAQHLPKFKDDIFGTVFNVIYGNNKGLSFGSVEQATKQAENLKLKDFTVTPFEINGSYFVSISQRASKETGFIDPVDTSKFGKRLGMVAREILSSSSLVSQSMKELGHHTASTTEALVSAGKRLEKIKNKVKGKDREWLEAVIQLGTIEQEGVWYGIKTLKNRFKFTDDQAAAYQAFRAEEDITDIIMNAADFTTWNSKGYKTIKLKKALGDLEEFAALPMELDAVPNPANKNIWNVTTGKFAQDMTTEKLTKMGDDGYKVYQLRGARETEVETPVQFLLMKEKDATIHPLNLRQIHYRPGGRVKYEDSWYLKLGRVRQGRGTVPIVLRAKTLGVGSEADIDAAAKAFTQAKEAWKVGDDAGVNKATNGRFENAQVFENYIGKKNLESTLPFEAVKDGERLPSINELVASNGAAYLADDINEASTIQRMIAVEGSFKSQRGGRLPMFGEELIDFRAGNPAPIVSPFETATASLSRAIRVASLDNFRKRQTQAWFETFGAVLQRDKHPGRTALGWLTAADKDKYVTLAGTGATKAQQSKAIKAAKAMETHIKTVLQTETLYDTLRRESLTGIAAIVSSKLKPFGFGESLIEGIEKFDPVKFVRSVVYHKTMGLFNVKQPATQLQASALMATIEPVHGIEAVGTTPILAALLLSENPGTIGSIAKWVTGIAPGVNSARIKEGLEVLKKTNNWRMNSNALPEQEFVTLSASTLTRKVLEFGEQPFLNSERFNKIASTYAAYLKWRKANPKAKITDDVINFIRTNGEEMVASMGRVDQNQLQRGFLGMITQFWGYPMRFLEMVSPQLLGGSKHFTGKQKWQMAFGQIAMHGFGGTVGVGPGRHMREVINREFIERYGEPADDRFLKIMERGFLSGLLLPAIMDAEEVDYYAKGLNFVDAGPGAVLTKLAFGEWDELWDLDPAGVKALVDIGGDFADIAEAIYALSPLDPRTTASAYMGLKTATAKLFSENIASLSNARKTVWALQYGQFLSSKGTPLRDDVTTSQAIWALFGISSAGEQGSFSAGALVRDTQQDEKDTIKYLSQHFRVFLESAGTEKDKKDWAAIREFYYARHDASRIDNIQNSVLHGVQTDRKAGYEQKLLDIFQPRSIPKENE
jgi:hypothetical protein